MKVEMLSTGDEVLHGQIVDTNALWLASTLYDAGFAMTFRTTSGDDLATLSATIAQRSRVADILIVNGGLGPTSDDFSAQAAADAAGVTLVRNAEWLEHLQAFFARRGREMAAINLKQADIPEGAEMLANGNGTACGFRLCLNDCQVFFTPGPPVEFQLMVTQQIIPRLITRFPSRQQQLCLRLTTFGRGESDIASQLASLTCPEGVVIGYRAAAPIVEIKLSGASQHQAQMQALWQQIKQRVAVNILFEGEGGFAAEIARLLKQQHYHLRLREGFTAGFLYWTLFNANTPLVGGEIGCMAGAGSRDAELTQNPANDPHGITLRVSELSADQQLEFTLVTPGQNYSFNIRATPGHYALQVRQEIVALQAMYLLHRWLTQQPVEIIYQGFELLERAQSAG